MAGRKAGSPNRSEFIRKHLSAKPEAKLSDVNDAWKKAGNSGELTATLFYQVKSKAGFVRGRGKRGGARRGRPPASASSAPGGYLAIEQALDGLIATAVRLGDDRLATDLRSARRHASVKLV